MACFKLGNWLNGHDDGPLLESLLLNWGFNLIQGLHGQILGWKWKCCIKSCIQSPQLYNIKSMARKWHCTYHHSNLKSVSSNTTSLYYWNPYSSPEHCRHNQWLKLQCFICLIAKEREGIPWESYQQTSAATAILCSNICYSFRSRFWWRTANQKVKNPSWFTAKAYQQHAE